MELYVRVRLAGHVGGGASVKWHGSSGQAGKTVRTTLAISIAARVSSHIAPVLVLAACECGHRVQPHCTPAADSCI